MPEQEASSSSSSNTKPDLKELAKILSDAYYNILQHSTLTPVQLASSLKQLAQYSNDLPTSWFTPQFLDTLIALKSRLMTEGQLEGLASIIALFSSWLRRLSAMDDARLKLVMDTLLELLLSTDNRYLSIQKDAWIGWVSLMGKSQDITLLEGMTKVLVLYTLNHDEQRTHALSEALDAGVAHALAQTNALNDFEVESCQKLLDAHIQYCAKRADGPRAIMTAIEHVVDVRSQEKPQSRAEADLATLVTMANDVVKDQPETLAMNFTCLAVLAGVVRMLQFNQGKKTKKVLGLRRDAEQTFIAQLDMAVDKVTSPEHVHDVAINQDIIAFFAGRCIIQIPSELALDMKHLSTLLKLLSASLLTSPYTFGNSDVIHRLQNKPEITREITQLINQPLFKDIGRISRAMAKIIEILLLNEQSADVVQAVLDRLVGFSYNVFFDWDQYIMDTADKSMTPEETKNFKELENAVWTVFKSMTFAFTVILKAVAVDIPDGKGLIQVPHAAQDIISVYANFNFITEHLGEGAGRQAYQDTLTNAVAYLLHDDNQCELNRLLSLAFKEYAPSKFVHDGKPTVELLSMVKQSRLTFFTDLIEQVMANVDDQVLENDILSVIYPVLKWKRIENKDLYESAHTAVITAFIAEKPVSRELAGVYAKILIDNFPEPMNLDQFRFGFNTLIQALCGLDDALAWLTVNQLILKIHSLNEEKDIPLRNEYTTALIDLLKPLSLGPFFPSILDEIRSLILAQETRVMQKATMKILFETVSGSGISDMRRTEAVGWFLELKRELHM
ncbi:hypothetical protein V8B55DRAFT_1516668 [Mucor lusitanicus]|uniref:Uncharacterized protein n=2 Tax=Mucor circinelloides f. lusitanicus TaxID=29924 RepID=A0A168L2F3_MUCCL|nr:hypothetical protein FB192DRAFT_1173913 [Mucor lusitanicus]OAD03036.1 hypothetical protein MUCCIDRAFT_81050 [Mucor lusitanicus CBS 277.49]